LARFGSGELAIMDPGIFDAPDLNRQYGAMKSTLGRNKAEVTAELLGDINPFMTVRVLPGAPRDPSVLREFMAGSALVIDAIDYVGFDYKAMFAEIARELGAYNLSAPIPDFGALLMVFAPDGMTLEEFYDAPTDKARWPEHFLPIPDRMGPQRSARGIREFGKGERPYISTNAGAASLCGGLLATEAALIISGVRPKEEIVTVPRVTWIDLAARVMEVFDAKAR